MSQKNFWIRMALFLLTALVIPLTYILIRYKILLTETSVKVSIGGFLALALLVLVVAIIIKYYVSGLKHKYSIIKQILSGVAKIIMPLSIVLLFCLFFRNKTDFLLKNIDKFIETLLVIIPCELIAIVINPLPKWAFENNVEGMSEIADKIFNKNKEEQA